MKKILRRFASMAGIALLFASCSGIPDEVTVLETSRLFSPTNFTALVINQINVQFEWRAVNRAESYQLEISENANFVGTPLLSVTLVNSQSPYLVTGLLSETRYYARMKAQADAIADSKWVKTSFMTDAEQIFILPVPSADIESDQVILRWPAGESADVINVYLGTNTSVTPAVVHTITPAEIADGSVVITGLQSDTQYTAVMKRGAYTRGTAVFSTKIDLGGATQVNEGDDLAAIIAAADDGEEFVLMSGTFGLLSDTELTKSISLRGYNSDARPIIQRATFKMAAGVSMSLDNLILEAANTADATTSTYLFQYPAAGTYGAIEVKGCDISGYERSLVQATVAGTVIESITVNNCTLEGFGKANNDAFDLRTSSITSFVFTNNTLWNSGAAGRHIFRIDNLTGASTPEMNISNNTFYNVVADRIFYIRRTAPLTVSKNMFVACNISGIGTPPVENVPPSPTPVFNNNNYYNNSGVTGNIDTGTKTSYDPEFPSDAATTGVFTVGNAVLKSLGVGDPRWLQ